MEKYEVVVEVVKSDWRKKGTKHTYLLSEEGYSKVKQDCNVKIVAVGRLY